MKQRRGVKPANKVIVIPAFARAFSPRLISFLTIMNANILCGLRPANGLRRSTWWSLVLTALFTLGLFSSPTTAAPPSAPPITRLRITVLSTMLVGAAQKGIGEWGFAALVETNNGRLLFDTGNRPQTVLQNVHELGLDLSDITDVVLSHNHEDHVGGLLTLRAAYAAKNPAALRQAHVAKGALVSRGPGNFAGDDNPLIAIRTAYEGAGGHIVEHDGPVELLPGVWFTGPIPRPHDEQPIPAGWVLRAPDGKLVPDPTPDDAALIFDTDRGLVVLTGCGHAGIINTVEYARGIVRPDADVYAVTGGLHLLQADDARLSWTAAELRRYHVRYLHGAHCTGLEAVYRLRSLLGLSRDAATVAAVGSWFDLTQGIDPTPLAQ